LEDFLVLDTDAASQLQAGRLQSQQVQQVIVGRRVCVTFVTVGELYKGAYKAGWGPRRIATLEQWLRTVLVLPYDGEVARRWGQLVAEMERMGNSLPANDSWIAACCLARDLPLLTLNRRHFERIPGLALLP
jgi:predicted nucleic acid-binding protein